MRELRRIYGRRKIWFFTKPEHECIACTTTASFIFARLWSINSVVVDVFRAGKIPESLYTGYEQQCTKMAAEILEGSTLIANTRECTVVMHQVVSVCLSCSGYDFWKPWPRRLHFWRANTSSEYPGHSRMSRSSGQGRGHRSKTVCVSCLWVVLCLLSFLVS